MLKTQVGDQWWLVQQPDHARVSGYLAAHWGNTHGFAQPGHFADAVDPHWLRQEVVHAIAEHDNGWWEWEATPEFDSSDTLPLNLPDTARNQKDAGLERWRIGVPRFADEHPLIALLISLHAYWLYAFAFDDIADQDDALRHPLFGQIGNVDQLVADRSLTRSFLDVQHAIQIGLRQKLEQTAEGADAIRDAHLLPHLRLLQTMDALSLLLCGGGQQTTELPDVPRQNWQDRVTIHWRAQDERQIICDPYPFDTDPLDVFVPVRTVSDPITPGIQPITRLHTTPLKAIRFVLSSHALAL
ncbi:MAG: DUF3891 family protein [Pirellulaceae bacterium]|nr:DUF3891 family protein [Pirellulaceae bacterium]